MDIRYKIAMLPADKKIILAKWRLYEKSDSKKCTQK